MSNRTLFSALLLALYSCVGLLPAQVVVDEPTQQLREDPQGISISTIGGLSWRYDRPGPLGQAEIYFPVFEARDIHVLSFRPQSSGQLGCPADITVACPAVP